MCGDTVTEEWLADDGGAQVPGGPTAALGTLQAALGAGLKSPSVIRQGNILQV